MFPSRQWLGAYLILATDDEILLATAINGPHEGRWELPGGALEHGEEPAAALARELHEHTGLELAPPPQLHDVWSHRGTWDGEPGPAVDLHHVGVIYRAHRERREAIAAPGRRYAREVGWLPWRALEPARLTPFAAAAVAWLQREPYRGMFDSR